MHLKPVHILAFLLVFQLICHLMTLNTIFLNDEGSFLTRGWLLTKGKIPYRDFQDPLYLPGTSLIAAASFSLLGPELHSAKIVLAFSGLLTTVLLFLITRIIYGESEALYATGMFVVLAPSFGSLAFLAEPFMAPFALALFYSLHLYDNGKDLKFLFAAGLLCSFLVILKITALFFLPAMAVYFATRLLFKKTKSRGFLEESAYFAFGFAIPLAVLFLVFSYLGVLPDVYEQLVLFFPKQAAGDWYNPIWNFTPYVMFLALLIAFFPRAKDSLKSGDWTDFILIILALASLNGVIRFQGTRVYYALPLVSIIVALLIREYMKHRAVKMVLVTLFLFFASFTLLLLSNTSQPEDRELIERITSLTSQDEKIFVLPFGHRLYFQAKREPATRALGFAPSGELDYNQEKTIDDLEKNKPKLVVYATDSQWGKNFSEYEPLIDKYLWDNYVVMGSYRTLLFLSPKNTT
jgi:hypothetical protein